MRPRKLAFAFAGASLAAALTSTAPAAIETGNRAVNAAAPAGSHHHAHDHDHAHQPGAGREATPVDGVSEPAGGPAPVARLDIGFTDHSGATGVLADLVDRPVLLAFFYTRCQNSRKCPMTVSRLAGLQRGLEAAGLGDRVRMLAITYEPQFDTPERLARYATNRGLALGPAARALRLDPERQQDLVEELRLEVAYNSGWVSGHGVELSLLDAGGRLVRRYQALSWQNQRVLEDVQRLLAGVRLTSADSQLDD